MLSRKLKDNGCQTIHAEGDADLLIAQTAVDSASKCITTVIGENADVLVLLSFHAKQTYFGLFLKSEGKTPTRKPKIWNIPQLQKNLCVQTCAFFCHSFM